jgi:hypothetical protein
MWELIVPTFSGWVFYVSNVVIVSGYIFASMLITRRKGIAKDMTWQAWVAGLSFFLLCGLTHVELAIHAFFNRRVINVDGTVDWHMLLIHIPQAASIWAFLWSMSVEPPPKAGDPPVPLEGAAAPPEAEGESENGRVDD